MQAQWSNEKTLDFLEAYQNEPIIWNPGHLKHKDKKLVNNAWIRLSDIFQTPVSELKKKKESVMASFRAHLRKKRASIRSGAPADEVYKPVWFAFDFMEKFLGPLYDSALNTETESNEGDRTLDGQIEDGQFEELSEPLPSTKSGASPQFDQPSTSTVMISRRRRNPFELVDAGLQIKQPYIPHYNDSVSRTQAKDEEDECDLFGRILAKKLRRIPDYERDLVMHEIDGIVIRRIRYGAPQHSNATSTYSSNAISEINRQSTFPDDDASSLRNDEIVFAETELKQEF